MNEAVKQLDSKIACTFDNAGSPYAKTDFGEIIKISTTKDSVTGSLALIESVEAVLNSLPTQTFDDMQVEYAKIMIQKITEDISGVKAFISLHKLAKIDVVLDDVDVCKLIDNLNAFVAKAEFAVGYMEAAVSAKNTLDVLGDIEPITFDQLSQLLAA